MGNYLDKLPALDWSDLDQTNAITKDALIALSKDKVMLGKMIRGVASNKKLMEQSLTFPSGDKLDIYDATDDRKFLVRVHFTEAGIVDIPHDHKHPFTSLILRGSYRHFVYYSKNQVNANTDPSTIQLHYIFDQEAGSCYSTHAAAVHSLVAVPGSLSLFLRGPDEFEDPTENQITPEELKNYAMTEKRLNEMVARLVALGVIV